MGTWHLFENISWRIVDFDNVKDYKTCFTIPQNHDLNNKCKEHLTWSQLSNNS